MNILGTGLSGLVGSRFTELNPDLVFTDISLTSGFDITKIDSIESVFKNFSGKFVVHFAAFTDTNMAWDQKGDKNGLCYQVNVVGTQNLIDLCVKYDKHLIHISTDYVFDGSKKTPYNESDQPNPLDWYGETKYLAEKLITDSNSSFTILRIAFPYRANFPDKIDLVRKIIGKLSKSEVCKLFSDQYSTPTFVDDIAVGIRHVIDNPQTGIFHLVGSSSQSIYQMGLLIAQTFGYDQNLIEASSLEEYLKTPNARPYAQNLSLSNNKFITTFDYQPKSLSEGLILIKSQIQL